MPTNKDNLRTLSIHQIILMYDMGNLLYVIAALLALLWLISYVGFGATAGASVHILLVLAAMVMLLTLTPEDTRA